MKQPIIKIVMALFGGGLLMAQPSSGGGWGEPMNQLQKEYYETTAPGVGSSNSSLLPDAQRLEYSRLELGVLGENGSYHRPQQPSEVMNYRFVADRAVRLGAFYLKGAFAFTQAFEEEVQFASILNPYRGTPYVIADSTGGDWRKQLYDMWCSLASPLYGDCFSFGLRAALNVGRGAKMIDPRPLSNSNSIAVAPSVSFQWGKHRLGGDLAYRRFTENSNMILYNSSESQKIYLMKGLGQYTYDIFSTTERERRYAGYGLGWGVQYLFRDTNGEILLDAGYKNYTEGTSDIEYNRPRQRGRLYENEYSLGLDALLRSGRVQHTLQIDYRSIERSGREIIQIFDPSPEVNAWVTDSEAPRRSVVEQQQWQADYSLFLMSDRPMTYRWKFSLIGEYESFCDEYKVMKSYLKYKSALAGVKVAHNLLMGQRSYLQPSVRASYRSVWDKSVSVIAREPDDRMIVDRLVGGDVDYLFQNYIQGRIGLTYGYLFANKSSLSVSGEYGVIRSEESRNRNIFSCKVGYNF